MEIYNRRFELSEPVLPDYPIFKGLELNAIWECLITLEITHHVKENIDFTAVRTQIFDRLKQMATILGNEGTFFYLENGYDSYNCIQEKNKDYLKTKELYQYIGECSLPTGYREGMEVFNKATREIQNKLAYQRIKKEK
ncbi:hypothetical protein LXD69_17065 [Flavobacterium sediminilitoris]|uniref:Uncharacterized protein n=1 Tax=Flavobacterium sediminilitoris TaxID=2024526 RepID=A0ABY4HLL1_9FLAO|nr:MULTISPECIES: hypothetical protein [Flavobacterium]UOX33731.1 hypothetical protein LXD69_17065 [Flavobacterium sediminilitoris]